MRMKPPTFQGTLYTGRPDAKIHAIEAKYARSTLQYFMNFFLILISLLTLGFNYAKIIMNEKANPVKTGDAKLLGLKLVNRQP